MGAKHPDFGGGKHNAIFKHHASIENVRSLLTGDIQNSNDVTVEEVTSETLKGVHIGHKGLVDSYFLPHDDYPNIDE